MEDSIGINNLYGRESFCKNQNKRRIKILYIVFVDYNTYASGSSVRPHMILDAFLQLGAEVKLLEGQQNKRQERRCKVRKIFTWLKDNRPDICYVEPPTGPFFNMIDLRLLNLIYKMNIPIGLFYRDAYWKFPSLFPMPTWKSIILYCMHKRDLRLFEKICDLVYFPSTSFQNLFSDYSFKYVKSLPPGGSDQPYLENNFQKKNYIYVGGTTEMYGGLKLIEAFRIINQDTIIANLTFIAPRTPTFNAENYDYPWLKILHTYDREIVSNAYRNITYALISSKIDDYTNLIMPLKLFEYLGYGIPVISTKCNEISRVLLEGSCGIVCEDDVNSIVQAIKQSLLSEEKYLTLKQNAIKTGQNNRWLDRAKTIITDLGGEQV